MKTRHSKTKTFAFWGAAFVLLIAVFIGCKQSAGGSGSGIGGTVHEAPFVEGGASLILSPDKLDIKVKVTTSDGTPITVEGCDKTELTSGAETVLHAQGTRVILKGKITALSCSGNRLTALDVQGLTALRRLECNVNQLTVLNVQGLAALKSLDCRDNQLAADAFKKLFGDLPQRADSDNAKCILYTERTDVTEGNHTDFTAPPDLAAAFDNAKNNKKWKMYKIDADGFVVEL